MATVNLGAIRFNWKGAYNNGTAYVADDVVSSAGSSYICILASTGNAVSNATYWSQMSSAGTDLSTTITTQGDVLYRDGSGLQRLAKGTASQSLTMNSGATAPEWTTPAAGAWAVKESGSSSNVTSLNFTNLTKTTQVILSNVFPATDGTVITSRISQDNGSSWITSGYRYDMQWARDNSNSVNDSGSGGSGAAYIRMGMLTGNAGGENESLTYTIYSPANTSKYTTMTFQGSIIESDAALLCNSVTGSAYYQGSTAAINGLQFLYTTGNISADYVVLELN
jgi:hypothetical protein